MFTDHAENLRDFVDARLGLFIHYGLYSLLGRGEWVLNSEQLDIAEYQRLADDFRPDNFDADRLAALAKQAGCRYLCLTTMHHDGFALYDSDVIPLNAQAVCGRDLVAETVAACRKHGLRVHLYHSLNNWTISPDGVDALESPGARKAFVDHAHARLEELLTKFNPIECVWYDGWWPFNADGWRAEEMNAKMRAIQPWVLVNGRNGLPGDFGTPEQHITAPKPWRPWEACVTHNGSWCHHPGDRQWKPTWEIVEMLTKIATGAGNLLLGVGPAPDGGLPAESARMLRELGEWTSQNGEAIYASQPVGFNHQSRMPGDRGDWTHYGLFTLRDNTLYLHAFRWRGGSLTVAGVETPVTQVQLLGGPQLDFKLADGKLTINNLPADPPHPIGGVIAITGPQPPSVYRTGGMRVPKVPHPRYDPLPSDLPT